MCIPHAPLTMWLTVFPLGGGGVSVSTSWKWVGACDEPTKRTWQMDARDFQGWAIKRDGFCLVPSRLGLSPLKQPSYLMFKLNQKEKQNTQREKPRLPTNGERQQLVYEWISLQMIPALTPAPPSWGPRHGRSEIRHPRAAMSKFLTHIICEHNK